MELPERKRTRIKHFDYSRNRAYFITICTQDRKQILSNIIESNKCYDKIFQRSFHDHIIRSSDDYDQIAKYIYENPLLAKNHPFEHALRSDRTVLFGT